MGSIFSQLVGFLVGAIVGMGVSGSFICYPFVIGQSQQAQSLSDISPEVAFQIIVDGGKLVNRCTGFGLSFELGTTGYTSLNLGGPLLFACLGWLVFRWFDRKRTQ